MGQHLVLTIRLHGDRQGTARYHGTSQGAPEWPPAPARVFQALLAGIARGNTIPEGILPAFEWLESLPPPLIAAPRAHRGERISLFVPNNDTDAVTDPRDVSEIRTQKVVHPTLFEEEVPFVYAWRLSGEAPNASAVLKAANDLYQLGRGVDMAWAHGELIDDEALENRLRQHPGTVHRPETEGSGKALACPIPGSLASLVRRYRAARFRIEGRGRSAKVLFTNAPKPSFRSVTYEHQRQRVVYELRDRSNETSSWPWPLHRVVRLIETIRDSAAARLSEGLGGEQRGIEQVLIGRTVDGTRPPVEQRVQIVPLPSIGHEYVDRAVRRILLEMPSGAPLKAADLEWAFSGLEAVNRETGVVEPLILTRASVDNMIGHYQGPSRRWRSVTAVALPESAKRRRIDPLRRRGEAKGSAERVAEEDRAVAAVHIALRHAGIRETANFVRVQRDPFEARGARAETFADGTRFAKERLWHVELELERSVEGPLVIGDGRFLGLGVMAPIAEPRSKGEGEIAYRRVSPRLTRPRNRSGLFAFAVSGETKDDPIALARALRRAVMARVQAELGAAPLAQFFSGHDESGAAARGENANHLAFQWDPFDRRLLVIAPHWLDRREPFRAESKAIEILDAALDTFVTLRAGPSGRLELRRCAIGDDDPLLSSQRTWHSVTPYAVTRHRKLNSAAEALIEDVVVACRRGGLPRPSINVLQTRGVQGRGLEGRVRLDFSVAVPGPIVLGRTRHLGGGLFASSPMMP